MEPFVEDVLKQNKDGSELLAPACYGSLSLPPVHFFFPLAFVVVWCSPGAIAVVPLLDTRPLFVYLIGCLPAVCLKTRFASRMHFPSN